MAITINHTIRKDKKRKDGTYTIYLRITEDRKSKYLATEHSIKLNEWNDNKCEVRGSHPLSNQINRSLQNNITTANHTKLELEKVGNLSADHILKKLRGDNVTILTLLEIAETYHKDLKKQNNYSEFKRFGVLKNQLQSFLPDKNTSIKNLNTDLIERFRDHLLYKVGNNNNTVQRKLRSLKAFTNSLLKKKKIKNDPFKFVKAPKSIPTEKTKLTIEQINKIKNLDLEVGSKLWHTRNFFFYSFYNAGIRFGDLCTLKWENIKNEKLTYRMRKTKKYKNIPQTEEALSILSHYGYPNEISTKYIFPLIKNDSDDIFELKKEIASRNTSQNKLLKELAKKAKIPENLSTHIARHSFAQYALEEGMDVYLISKLLGHSGLKTTERYLKSFDEEMIERKLKDLF